MNIKALDAITDLPFMQLDSPNAGDLLESLEKVVDDLKDFRDTDPDNWNVVVGAAIWVKLYLDLWLKAIDGDLLITTDTLAAIENRMKEMLH